MTQSTSQILKRTSNGMNTDLLMIWLPIWLNQMVDMSGHARIMMVMSNQMLSLKVLVHWD